MSEENLSLFDASLYDEPIEEPQKIEGACSKCEHIIGVKFTNKTLYFCSFVQGDRRYGRYGKKIKKSHEPCFYYKVSNDAELPVYDGHYGGQYGTSKRS